MPPRLPCHLHRVASLAARLGLAILASLLVWGAGWPVPSIRAQQAAAPAGKTQPGDAAGRGEYIFRASGGCGCHTDFENKGARLSGGRGLKTPFGTFYSTNITPHRETGLGSWKERDFIRAMRQGIGPEGQHYFPVFPYTSFSGMSDGDLKDLWAFLRSVKAVEKENRPHDVPPPFGWRIGLPFWKSLNFRPTPFLPDPGKAGDWNRGAYLVRHLAHCGECHTPRGLLGGFESGMFLAGSSDGPEGELAPNITPDSETGIGEWSREDLVWYLEQGLKPDGDDSQGLMAEMIEHGFQYLSEGDRLAIAVYLASLPPIHNPLKTAAGE